MTRWLLGLLLLLVALTSSLARADPLGRLPGEVRRFLDHLPTPPAGQRLIAVFDHDRTVVRPDLGEQFMKWMLRKRHFPRQGQQALQRAWRRHQQGRLEDLELFKLAVTAMAGLKESRVRELAARYYRLGFGGFEGQIFAPQRALIEELQRRGVEVYLVSASSPWLIEESAKRLGVPAGRVIAMTAEVDASGRLTRELTPPLPWKEGKVDAIRARGLTARGPIILAAGDSAGDLRMLELPAASGGLSLAVNPQQTPRVARAAREHGWASVQLGPADLLRP